MKAPMLSFGSMFLAVSKKRTKTDAGAVVASVNEKVTGPCGSRSQPVEFKT